MPAKMNPKTDAAIVNWPRWFPVADPSFGDIKVKLRKPTAQEQAIDEGLLFRSLQGRGPEADEAGGRRKYFRAFGLAVDWEGVEDDAGKPVAFTAERLAEFVATYPAAYVPLSIAGDQAFVGLADADLGKSLTPQEATSSATDEGKPPP